MSNFWDTIEVYCACRDFGYSQYLEMCEKYSHKSKALSPKGYGIIQDILHTEMLIEMENKNV